jgi:hypothetical protein
MRAELHEIIQKLKDMSNKLMENNDFPKEAGYIHRAAYELDQIVDEVPE